MGSLGAGNLCIGWGRLISLDKCSFRIGCMGELFNTGKMAPSCRLPWRRAQQNKV